MFLVMVIVESIGVLVIVIDVVIRVVCCCCRCTILLWRSLIPYRSCAALGALSLSLAL